MGGGTERLWISDHGTEHPADFLRLRHQVGVLIGRYIATVSGEIERRVCFPIFTVAIR